MKLFIAQERLKHTDARGVIEDVFAGIPGVIIKSVLFCTGKDGAIRGNHYHSHDTHYCLVLSGVIKYQYIEPGEKVKKTIILKRGDMVFTPVDEKHRFIFLKKGAFLTFATESREQKSYEEDTKRISF